MTEQTWRKLGLVVPPKDADTWDQRPSVPCILRTNDRYLMYFHGEQYFSDRNKVRRVGLAEASLDDPMAWTMVGDDPLIDLGPEGSIDSHWVSYPWVVPITDTHWRLYYAAWDGAFLETAPNQKQFTTCLAESDDGGMTWRRGERPLLEPGRPYAPAQDRPRILHELEAVRRAQRRPVRPCGTAARWTASTTASTTRRATMACTSVGCPTRSST